MHLPIDYKYRPYFIARRCRDTLYWNPKESMDFDDAARKKRKMNIGCGKRPKYFVVDSGGSVYRTMHVYLGG